MSTASNVDGNQGRFATAAELYASIKAAAKAGDLDNLKAILSEWRSNPTVSGPSQENVNYLISLAAEGEGQPEVLKYLLSEGGEINTYTIGQTTSLVVFQIFIDHGWKVNNAVFGSHMTNPDLVALFLSHGADPKGKGSENSFSLLDRAALHAPLETIKLLTLHGATIEPDSAALHAAAQGDAPDRISVMAYLLEHGADINGFAADIPAPSEARRSGRKGTPLHTAYKWKSEEAKTWLLEHGADPTIKNAAGETPEEWGRRFDSDGPEKGVRLRRAILRKNKAEKEEAEAESR